MAGISSDLLAIPPGQQIPLPQSRRSGLQVGAALPSTLEFVRMPSRVPDSAISDVADPIGLAFEASLRGTIEPRLLSGSYIANQPQSQISSLSPYCVSHHARSSAEPESSALDHNRAELFNELDKAGEEFRNENWDGYGAIPVSEETFRIARRFILAIPPYIPNPTLGAEPDGHITFEWYRSPRCTVSVSVSPEGDLHYAALREIPRNLLGRPAALSKTYGTEVFSDEIPEVILGLISPIMAA